MTTNEERYKWLREADWIDDAIMEHFDIKTGKPETLDAAIDKAISDSAGERQ